MRKRPRSEPEDESRADVFNLIPPRASDKYERPKGLGDTVQGRSHRAAGQGRRDANIHPATAIDLTRLSIDNGGHLYWDGKPVEVQRRLMMSRNR